MKRYLSIFFLLLLFVASPVLAKKGGKEKKVVTKTVYVWGVSMAFSDSVVYFTEVQPIEGVAMKGGFLPDRHMYAYELKDYMSFQENMPGRTSFIFFSEKRKKLEKKEAKIKKRLTERDGKTVRYLGDKFKFTKH